MVRTIAIGTAAVALLLGGGTALAGVTLADAVPGALAKPVIGASISQGFGCTSLAFEPVDAACAGGHWHSGIDLACARGTPVHATLGGVATVIGSRTGYGLHVIVDHGGGLSSLYAHLEAALVRSGAFVDAGAVIGLVGSSGASTGPHLHFEIRRNGVPEDPGRDVPLP